MIPIISSILFWLGGRDQMNVPFNQKLFRRLWLPVFLGICGWILTGSFLLGLFSGLLYAFSLNVFSWGETHWLRKLFGRDKQWIVYGFFYGVASCFVLGWLSIVQGIIGGCSCWFLMKWSNDGLGSVPYIGTLVPQYSTHKLSHQYVELALGFMGTILWILK